ncbi:MAG: OmpH family outer membrane protein [Blastocatellia bacterium]
MKTKLLLTLALALPLTVVAGGNAQTLAQTGAAAGGPVPKTKIAIVDVMAFRDSVAELKVKYDKLQTEFAPRYRELEAMQSKLASQEKVLNENQTLTQQQGAKLTQEFQEGKKTYERMVQDAKDIAAKREDEETGPIKEKLSKFLEQYCTKHGISYVYDGRALQETGIIIYAAPAANATDDFIKEYNKAYPAQAASVK